MRVRMLAPRKTESFAAEGHCWLLLGRGGVCVYVCVPVSVPLTNLGARSQERFKAQSALRVAKERVAVLDSALSKQVVALFCKPLADHQLLSLRERIRWGKPDLKTLGAFLGKWGSGLHATAAVLPTQPWRLEQGPSDPLSCAPAGAALMCKVNPARKAPWLPPR